MPAPSRVKALQCLLKERGSYRGAVNGSYSPGLVTAVRAWKVARGWASSDRWYRRDWMSLLSHGARIVVKYGSVGAYVRRVQRTLNAAGSRVKARGVFDSTTVTAVRAYQRRVGLPATGVVDPRTWSRLMAGVVKK